MSGQPNKTTAMPPKNATLPLALCRWKKNLNVLSSPMTQAKPAMKRI
jgi:hypothetical protein